MREQSIQIQKCMQAMPVFSYECQPESLSNAWSPSSHISHFSFSQTKSHLGLVVFLWYAGMAVWI